jgi:hypothetical protein
MGNEIAGGYYTQERSMKIGTWRSIFTALILALVLAACGGGTGGSGESGQPGGGQGEGGSENAQVVPGDFGYIFNSDKNGVIITYYTGNSSSVIIPDTIENYPVVGLRGDIFKGSETLASISFPDTVTEIPDSAFAGCASLTSVKWPASLVTIGSSAFQGTALTALELPSRLTAIEESAFQDCGSLTTVTLPEGLAAIEESAFQDCGSLTSVTLPESLTSINNFAFYNDRELISLNVPAGLIQFPRGYYRDSSAFGWCHKLPLAVRDKLIEQGYSGQFF